LSGGDEARDQNMSNETEIKLKITDAKALHRSLKRLGARAAIKGVTRVREENLLFDTPESQIAKNGQVLRIRMESPELAGKKAVADKSRTILTFKRPVQDTTNRLAASLRRDYKVREEFELEVSDGAALSQIFAGLGMRAWFRYEKYRTTYKLPASKSWAKNLLIEFDETPIGTFVELEGPADAIDRAASELGFSKQDYILKNYLLLYVEDCRKRGEQPKDMIFAPEKPRRK
jgi:adenylate cyclase class 2